MSLMLCFDFELHLLEYIHKIQIHHTNQYNFSRVYYYNQMAINIANARDTVQIFGSVWATFVAGVAIAKLSGRTVPPVAGVPIAIGGILLGNIADMAYGNKLARVSKEAEHILVKERARLVPMKQAPVSRFYTVDEKAAMFIRQLLQGC